MMLYHTTHRRYLKSILREGLLAKCDSSLFPVVWLHTRNAILKAREQVLLHHFWNATDLVVIRVWLPRTVTVFKTNGCEFVAVDLPADAIRGLVGDCPPAR